MVQSDPWLFRLWLVQDALCMQVHARQPFAIVYLIGKHNAAVLVVCYSVVLASSYVIALGTLQLAMKFIAHHLLAL